jgi:hypothetical protein
VALAIGVGSAPDDEVVAAMSFQFLEKLGDGPPEAPPACAKRCESSAVTIT